MEVIMKKMLYLVITVFGIYGTSEGMLHSDLGQRYVTRRDCAFGLPALVSYNFLQEQWNEQRKMMLLQQIERIVVPASERILFDKDQLLSNVNTEIKEKFETLLNESLDGNVDSLVFLSERIYNGRLFNRLIFNSLANTLEKRKEIIFQVSLELYRKIPGIGESLKNIIRYCPEKAKEIGLQDFFDEINELF
jgi:hypothetical protein